MSKKCSYTVYIPYYVPPFSYKYIYQVNHTLRGLEFKWPEFLNVI